MIVHTKAHYGTPWHTVAHHGTPRNTKAHQGRVCFKVVAHHGTPRHTKAECASKLWHTMAECATKLWHTMAHQGTLWYIFVAHHGTSVPQLCGTLVCHGTLWHTSVPNSTSAPWYCSLCYNRKYNLSVNNLSKILRQDGPGTPQYVTTLLQGWYHIFKGATLA